MAGLSRRTLAAAANCMGSEKWSSPGHLLELEELEPGTVEASFRCRPRFNTGRGQGPGPREKSRRRRALCGGAQRESRSFFESSTGTRSLFEVAARVGDRCAQLPRRTPPVSQGAKSLEDNRAQSRRHRRRWCWWSGHPAAARPRLVAARLRAERDPPPPKRRRRLFTEAPHPGAARRAQPGAERWGNAGGGKDRRAIGATVPSISPRRACARTFHA